VFAFTRNTRSVLEDETYEIDVCNETNKFFHSSTEGFLTWRRAKVRDARRLGCVNAQPVERP